MKDLLCYLASKLEGTCGSNGGLDGRPTWRHNFFVSSRVLKKKPSQSPYKSTGIHWVKLSLNGPTSPIKSISFKVFGQLIPRVNCTCQRYRSVFPVFLSGASVNSRKTTTGIPVSQWVSQSGLFKGLLDGILLLPDKPCHFASQKSWPNIACLIETKLVNMFVIIRLQRLPDVDHTMGRWTFNMTYFRDFRAVFCWGSLNGWWTGPMMSDVHSKNIICWCKNCFGRNSVWRYFT